MAEVSGVWVFNDVINEHAPRHDVNFTSNGGVFNAVTSIITGNAYNGYKYYVAYRYDISSFEYAYSFEANAWYNKEYKTVDFGSTPQTVSQEFFDWLSTNATSQNSIDPPVTYELDKVSFLQGWLVGSRLAGMRK